MNIRTSDLVGAITRLPGDAVLTFDDISWEEYEALIGNLAHEWPGMRVTYDHGKLEIVSPSFRHERNKEFIGAAIRVLAEELHLALVPAGSTTLTNRNDLSGAEPDACFYIANANRIIGKEALDLSTDPPPDLAVEIDVSNQSLSKFPIYAGFGVPEVWRYIAKKNLLVMYELQGSTYIEIKTSRSFPIVTPDVLSRFLEKNESQNTAEALADFRKWVRTSHA